MTSLVMGYRNLKNKLWVRNNLDIYMCLLQKDTLFSLCLIARKHNELKL